MSLQRRRSSFQGMSDENVGSKQCGNPSWIYKGNQWVLMSDGGDEAGLIYVKRERLPMKDFGSEVRGQLDATHFFNHAVILLDVDEISLDQVVDKMLGQLFLVAQEPNCLAADAKACLFSSDSNNLIMSKTIQGTLEVPGVNFEFDQSWICAVCTVPTLERKQIAVARLKTPMNFGENSEEIRLLTLVLCPSKEKGTKSALEVGRTFSTIFSVLDYRQSLLTVETEEEFKRLIMQMAQELSEQQSSSVDMDSLPDHSQQNDLQQKKNKSFACGFGRGIREDLRRRLPFYISDYVDGLCGPPKTIHKTISTTFFLYFACILPSIAFGVLNDVTTHGILDVRKVIMGQTIGGLIFAVFGGQPLNILLTTAPLCLFVKIVHSLSEDYSLGFEVLYCFVGLWSSFFTLLYSVFDVSRIMKWSTRSLEEIFGLFISIAFCLDAAKDTIQHFKDNYFCVGQDVTTFSVHNATNLSHTLYRTIQGNSTTTLLNKLVHNEESHLSPSSACSRDVSLLYLILMIGTLWLGLWLYNLNKTPYLQAGKREILSDYALAIAVLAFSFIGSFVFQAVPLEPFRYTDSGEMFKLVDFSSVSLFTLLLSLPLGFCHSILILMDQSISSATVNNPSNRLKKGPAYHWDLLVVSFINGFLSIFTLPWMHAAVPHCALHMRSLADVEERIDRGHVQQIIVRVRETRLTGILSHVLIGLSLLLLPYPLKYIPPPVLNGLFLYMAITALEGNQLFERLSLLLMEQTAYPPTHYIRRVNQKKIHQFTGLQVIQLTVMCIIGFSPFPFMKMAFPLTLFLLLPIRHQIIPRIISPKFLNALDGDF